MVKALTSPQKESFALVTFQYGDPASPSFAYYTNRSEGWVGQFVSTPNMDIQLPKNSTVFNDELCTIKLPVDTFVDRITSGSPTEPISMKVEELTLPVVIGESATRLVLFVGKVTSTIKNKDSRSGNRVIKAKSWKQFFAIKMGVPADHQCPFIFNGRGCNSGTFAGGSPLFKSPGGGTILSIDGHKITLTASLTVGLDHLYRKGYISFEGINIGIRDFDAGVDAAVLYLTRQPPLSWIGQGIAIFPGCDKTIENCRDQDNEANFGGIGFAIPAYNPNFEGAP